jgi:hypothetical protein
MSEPSTNSLNVDVVIVEGPSLPPREGPLPPGVRLWLDYERDRIANPHTPRPYRPYLTPPPHQSPAPPQEPGAQVGDNEDA